MMINPCIFKFIKLGRNFLFFYITIIFKLNNQNKTFKDFSDLAKPLILSV